MYYRIISLYIHVKMYYKPLLL
ncbi:unnamed protein product [Spirodela intermedia]|uniref:Uncharacterized protein n=1 Tax=Spirodela intermedia TaxID=51605 RepID=A0A7I8LH71_SPIIN|nr:unnamed protein product [Spirodela intermedia]